MITLYWAPRTRSVRIVWLLEESGLPYQREVMHVFSEGERSVDLLAASPMGKVPALRDGDVTVWDSAAICGYLCDRYPEINLAPAIHDPARAAYWQWMVFTPSVIEPAMAEKYDGWSTRTQRNPWGSFDRMIDTFETAMRDRTWIIGDTFSAADVMLGSSAIFLRRFSMLPDSPVLEAYADRCMERPALQRALALEPED